jgi:hypothetical protein
MPTIVTATDTANRNRRPEPLTMLKLGKKKRDLAIDDRRTLSSNWSARRGVWAPKRGPGYIGDKSMRRDEDPGFGWGELFSAVDESEPFKAVIKGQLFAEIVLNDILSRAPGSLTTKKLDKMSFHQKLEEVRKLALLPEHILGPLKSLNKLRNKFAHELRYEIADQEYDALFDQFPSAEVEANAVAFHDRRRRKVPNEILLQVYVFMLIGFADNKRASHLHSGDEQSLVA